VCLISVKSIAMKLDCGKSYFNERYACWLVYVNLYRSVSSVVVLKGLFVDLLYDNLMMDELL